MIPRLHDRIAPKWSGERCIIAATGPSLEAFEIPAGVRFIAVNDAYRLFPAADVLYACDLAWWNVHAGAAGFAGERWSSHDIPNNDKTRCKWELDLIAGRTCDGGFSTDPSYIVYGSNSGFQACGLALHFGAVDIALIGFDMHDNTGKGHFFGRHPRPLQNGHAFRSWIHRFGIAAKALPAGVTITNCTPGSALHGFPRLPIEEWICRTGREKPNMPNMSGHISNLTTG